MNTEAEAVADIVRGAMNPIPSPVATEAPLLVYPRSEKVESLERFLGQPLRKRARLTVRDHSSFIEYVARMKEAGTIVLADMNETGGSFTALIDFHEAEPKEQSRQTSATTPAGAHWCEHTCKYVAEHSPEWRRWMTHNQKPMDQVGMAEFLEDNLLDVRVPDGASMLEMVKTLEATQGAEFKSVIRLDNGDRQLAYAHTTNAKAGQRGDIEIPDKFQLRLPVFTNGPEYEVDCRFRYRISDGVLRVGYEIVRPHKIVDLALAEARTAIVQTLGIPVLLGSAERTS